MLNNQIHSMLNKQIPAIQDELSSINRGGCGHAALAMHQALRARGIFSTIVLVNMPHNEHAVARMIKRTGRDNINDAYNYMFDCELDTWGNIPHDTLNGHVCVLFDGKLYDSEGEHPCARAISEHINIPTMTKFLTIDSCWNSTFRNANCGIDWTTVLSEFFDRTLSAAGLSDQSFTLTL